MKKFFQIVGIILATIFLIGGAIFVKVALYKLSCKYEMVSYFINSRCYEYRVIRGQEKGGLNEKNKKLPKP